MDARGLPGPESLDELQWDQRIKLVLAQVYFVQGLTGDSGRPGSSKD